MEVPGHGSSAGSALKPDTPQAVAVNLLARLLRKADRRRREDRSVSEAPDYSRLRTGTDKAVFRRILDQAAATGAVSIVPGRYERAHLIEKIRLADADRLAAFLGMERLPIQARRVADMVRTLLPEVGWTHDLLDHATARWTRGESAFGLAIADEADIEARFRILAALARGKADGIDPRTFSARVFPLHPNDASKIVERHLGGMLPMLRAVIQGFGPERDEASAGMEDMADAEDDRQPSGISDDDVLERFGLLRFTAPVFLSGPVEIDLSVVGSDVRLPDSTPPFITPHREWLPGFHWRADVASPRILTIENLTSFHRHVREIRQDDVCTVYTGGFLSMTVLSLLRRLLATSPTPPILWHWGDVDAGGARIAEYLEQSLGASIRPHLMGQDLVAHLGRAGHTGPLAPLAARAGTGAEIARVILDTGLLLEQERVDPQPVPAL